METFGKYTDNLKELYSDHERLISDRVIFRQIYKVTPHAEKSSPLQLDYTIDENDYCSHPILILDPVSVIPYQSYKPQELFAMLVQEINKIKALRGMLVGMYSDAMVQDIKDLVKLIYARKFNKKAKILLFNGIEPELAQPSQLILHFEMKHNDSQIKEVEVDELIVEYLKPVYGKNGLDAYGKRIKRGESENEEFLGSTIDQETIKTVEDEKSIKLYSKKRGFVHFNTNIIEISNKITLQKINRVQSQVAKEEENEVEIVITQDDITEDSVGEGVHLTSETIHISGYVADKAKLEARVLMIDGASHNGSQLYAKEATINRHKGYLRCHKATIALLEGGEVHATHIHIDTALGGAAYGEHVTIKHLKHHLKIYATGSITIERISGEDNHLTIDYKQIPIIQSRLEYIQSDIDELRYYLDDAKRRREQDVPKISKKIVAFKEEIEEIKSSGLNATISIKEPLRGLNTLTFVLPKNRVLSYRTREGQTYTPFHVHATDDRATLKPVGTSISL